MMPDPIESFFSKNGVLMGYFVDFVKFSSRNSLLIQVNLFFISLYMNSY